jgi:hypothetical protein
VVGFTIGLKGKVPGKTCEKIAKMTMMMMMMMMIIIIIQSWHFFYHESQAYETVKRRNFISCMTVMESVFPGTTGLVN